MLQRVGDDVGEELVQPCLVALQVEVIGNPLFDRVPMASVRVFERPGGLADELGEVDRHDLQACGARFQT